jgi:hypothetical protein
MGEDGWEEVADYALDSATTANPGTAKPVDTRKERTSE